LGWSIFDYWRTNFVLAVFTIIIVFARGNSTFPNSTKEASMAEQPSGDGEESRFALCHSEFFLTG